MHWRNDVFFNKVLPEFLQTTRDLFVKFSLFVRLDKIEITKCMVDSNVDDEEKDGRERSLTLHKWIDNFTFSSTAVQSYHAVTEQFNVIYSDEDKVDHPVSGTISSILKIPPENITIFCIGKPAWLVKIDRPEEAITSESDLTAITVEVLKLLLDLTQPIKSIEQIQYPVACFGALKFVAKVRDGVCNLSIYGPFGSRCCNWTDIRMESYEPAMDVSLLEQESSDDSPTIRCLTKIGINHDGIDRQETFTSIGLDSLQCAELEIALQSQFPQYNIPTGIAMRKPTVEEMDAYLMSCDVAYKINNKDVDAYSGHIPLSPQQRGLLFMSELEPHTRAQFNEPVVFTTSKENFNQSRFRKVLNSLAMRHTILRTSYFANGQTVLSGTEAFFACGRSSIAPQNFVQLSIDVRNTSMNTMVWDSAGRTVVCLVFHHIAVDGHSINIITREIGALYSGERLPLPRRQYADYAIETASLNYEMKLAKWREHLKCREFQLLITDKPRTAKRTYNGASIQKRIPATLQNALKKLRQAANCTNFCIFAATYKFLVYKTYGISDFPIGFPSTLRTKEHTDTVGCFVNMVPLVELLDPSQTLAQYLSRISAAITEAKSMDVPLDVLVSGLGIERDDNVAPLFQVLLVMDSVQLPSTESDISLLECPTRFAKYEQTWYFRNDGKSIYICVEYNSDLFRQQTIEDYMDRFLFILKTFQELPPHQMLMDISIMKHSELRSIYKKRRGNTFDIPEITVLEMFYKNLSTKSSINYKKERMSYEELNSESSKMADSITSAYLSHYGELPSRDRCATVFMERSLDLSVIIFAIWKSGMAAVPLSLDLPPQRVISMLEMLTNPILITTKNGQLLSSAKHMGVPVLDQKLHNRERIRNLNRITLSDMAYITCTSGTTGNPKLVCTEFSGHSNLAAAYTETFLLHNNSHAYQVVNYSFDIFFADLTKTFVNGASITLAEGLIPNIAEMDGVTNAYIMPAYLSSLSTSDIERLSFLESIHFGGEAIQPSALRLLLQTGVDIFHEHGVTEQTVFTMANRMHVNNPISEMGPPYRNLHCLLRDGDQQLLPVRYKSTYYVNGCGLFRGYYGNEELNAKTLRKGIFGKEMRTGDVVKCEHGRLHFQGRNESQIQHEIASNDEVDACTVVVHEENGVRELVAYVILNSDGCWLADALVHSLSERVPSYCVPKHFVPLKKFPLNQNGKIDKKLLPKPLRQTSITNSRPPQGELETVVADSFKRYTQRDFMADECFFDFGGDSVKAMLVVQDLAARGYKLELSTLFSLRTAEKIANHLGTKEQSRRGTSEMPNKDSCSFEIPLSPQQKRLWFLAKMYPDRDSYMIRLQICFSGQVDVIRLKHSFNVVVIGHPALRSNLDISGNEPLLTRLSGTECFHDLTQQSEENSLLDLSSLVTAQIAIAPQNILLDLRIHHLICDGRSLAIIGEQLAAAYNGAHTNIGHTLHQQEEDGSLDFWRTYLSDYEPLMIQAEGDVEAFDGEAGYIEVVLDFVKEHDMREVCSTNGCTPFQILVLCYVEALRAVQDTSDIVIGTTIANRTPENMDVVGLFANTIPLRFQKEFVGFPEHLSYVQRQVLSAMEHQSTPLAKIIEEVVVDRDATSPPLFRHVLTLLNASTLELPKMTGIQSEVTELRSTFTQFDQSWIFHQGKELSLVIQYDKHRCSTALIKNLLDHFKFLLNRILKRKPVRLSVHSMTDLPTNDTPRCKSLGTIFDEQAALLPSGICLQSSSGNFSFKNAVDASKSFAYEIEATILQHTAELPRADDVICLILPESIENHIVIESVHLLGCAYLCLSPDTPIERIQYILADCQAKLVVTHLTLGRIPVPTLSPEPSFERKVRWWPRSCSTSLAYLIYTSGTTGTPKGVCVSHQSTLNMLKHATRLYSFRPGGRVLQFTKSSFDASISNTFGCLLNGGILSIRDENADVVRDLAKYQPITVLHMTPIVMEMFDEQDLNQLSDVEIWSYGGETISESTLSFMIDRGQRVVQLYGPTEVTCYQTSLKMRRGHSPTCIGHTIPGLQYGLCSFSNPIVQRKSVGQFFCTGENLARGYTSTADRGFTKNPFRTFEDRVLRRNHRMYLVGDRLKRDEKEYLHFLGRNDDQVKVKGHRVELSEIEAAARSVDGVTNAVAVIQKDRTGSNHIVLFYSGPAKEPLAVLGRQIPPAVLPSKVVQVAEFPLTLNHKIDRAKLSLGASFLSFSEDKEEPRDHVDQQVLNAYREVLQQHELDINSNFFQAGGHSLLVVQLVSALEKSLEVSVPIVKIFEFPHVRDLADWVRSVQKVLPGNRVLNYLEDHGQPSPLQITLLRSFRNPKTQALYDISFTVALKKPLSARACVKIVNQLSMIHPSLRTRFTRIGSGYSREVLSGTECFQNMDIKTDFGLNPLEKPPFLASFDGNSICIVVNHVIVDGHSMQIIVDSLAQILNRQQVTMDDGLMLQSWLRERFQKSKEDDVNYWKGSLKEYVYNQLPTTFPRLVVNSSEAGTLVLPGGQLTSKVQSWIRRYGCSPFVAVLTLLSRTLQQHSCDPQLPIAIGFPVNLRTQELQNSVGYGVNTVLMLQDTRGTLSQVLQSVMGQVAKAMSHAFIPYEDLIELSPSKKLFSVMLIYDSYTVYENEGIIVTPAAASVTKFELSVFVDPDADTIQYEYNRNLFDQGYINDLAQTFQNVICNWDYHISPKVNNPLHIGQVVYDPSDIKKLLAPLPNEDLHFSCSNGVGLHYSSDNQIDDDIRKALEKLPKPLRPQRIVFSKKITEEFPLSPQQLQMYYLSLEHPEAHVLPFLKKFPKTVQLTHLHKALLYQIQRHESLRTIFFEKEGQPMQVVLSMTEAYVSLNIQKTSSLKESIELLMRTPLPLTGEVPLMAALFETHDYIAAALLLNHIISDAWSTTIIEQEMNAIMQRLQCGERPSVTRQNHSYTDYCQEIRKDAEIEEAYITDLLSAEAIPHVQAEGEVERLQFEFPETLAVRWTKSSSASLFTVVLMILSNSIMSTFGLKSINVGAPHSNRSAKTKSIVGYFLNNLVFHINKNDNEKGALHTLQRHVGEVLLKNIPFSELVTSMHLMKRHLQPLFYLYFNCRYDLESDESDDEEIMSMLPVISEFPLEIDLDKCLGGYRITIRTQQCLPSETGKRIMEDIQRQLFSAAPSQPLQSAECSGSDCLEAVVQIALKVLGVETVDINESFFSAGGNSLQVIAFVEMLEESLNVNIKIAEVYEMKSFSEFANQLHSKISAAQGGECHEDSEAEMFMRPQTPPRSSPTHSHRKQVSEVGYSPQRNPQRNNQCDIPSISLSSFLLNLERHEQRACITEPGGCGVSYAELARIIEGQAASIRLSYCQVTGETLRNDTIIPIIGDSCGSTIITLLSILSAGAAYLPIDSTLPLERILLLLKESHTECYVGERIAEIPHCHLTTTSFAGRFSRLLSSSSQKDLAYVIYTSGTTGIPKGVCINHLAVMNMMRSSTSDFRLKPDDVIYQFTNFTYDNSVLEIFMTLANGAKLVVDTVAFLPRRFADLMEHCAITHCLLFPGIVATFSQRHFKKLAALRYWIVGAEKLPQRMFDTAIEAGVSVIQNYGPTETTAYALTKHMRITDLSNNLGKEIRNTDSLVGETGELILRGKGIMRGYLGLARKEVLLEGSWYSTGDQVRLLANGDILFMGRKDNQVKIRGHRVELGEVEAVVSATIGVKQCAVVYKEADQVLLAFITLGSPEGNVEGEVLDSCSKLLPNHMRPAHVLTLDEFPLTKNSKVDVALLSADWKRHLQKNRLNKLVQSFFGRTIKPQSSLVEDGGCTRHAIELGSLYMKKYGQTLDIAQLLERPLKDVGEKQTMLDKKTRNSEKVKERLRKIWRKVLKHDTFGLADHFFFSGGNSISLIKLRYEINTEFQAQFTIQDLLNCLVFSEMSAMIESTGKSVRIATIVHNPPTPPCGLVFIHALYGGSAPYSNLIKCLSQMESFQIITVQHPNTFGFESDDVKFFESIKSLAQRYAAEVAELLNGSSDTVLIGASLGGTIAVEMTNYLEVKCKVIVIDSGTDYQKLKGYSFEDHRKSVNDALMNYAIDDITKFWMVLNSWDMLIMLRDYEPTPPSRIEKLNVFSIDGSDLGWSRLVTTSTTRIVGTHADMLSEKYCHDLANEIVGVLSRN